MAKRVAVAKRVGSRPLDLGHELDRLEVLLRRELDTLPAELRPLEAALPALIGKADAGTRWVDRFAPLTLLYPLLHAEALDGRWRKTARSLVLPQTLLVLHAFLDDRRRDRQVAWSGEHGELDAWLVAHSLGLFGNTLGRVAAERALELLLACEEAQARQPQGPDELAELVVSRHQVGLVSTRCLLEVAAAPATLVEAAVEGFRSLVLGLQWMDDLEDLREDLSSGAPNLLLEAIGPSARGADLASVLSEIHVRGLDQALASASAHFEAACGTFGGMALTQLRALVDERCHRVAELRRVLSDARASALALALGSMERTSNCAPEPTQPR